VSDYAPPDYEPTADEIDEFRAGLFSEGVKPGEHGEITLIPCYERYIWEFPVFWGHREVDRNGHIRFSYCVPLPCPQEES
jgi:hypothetical protein